MPPSRPESMEFPFAARPLRVQRVRAFLVREALLGGASGSATTTQSTTVEDQTLAVTIEKMTEADWRAVIELWQEVGLPAKPSGRDSINEIRRQLGRAAGLYLVARDGGTLVGTALGTHDGRKGWINRVAVAPGHRRRGIAERLVRALEEQLRELGIDVIACLIEGENVASLALFQRLGYAPSESIVYLSRRSSPDS